MALSANMNTVKCLAKQILFDKVYPMSNANDVNTPLGISALSAVSYNLQHLKLLDNGVSLQFYSGITSKLPAPKMTRLSFLYSIFGYYVFINSSLIAADKDPIKIGEKIFELKPFVIYEAEVNIIDGHTGEKYEGTNDVVLDFADTFNAILLGFHKKLLEYEIRHLNFRLEDGRAFEAELRALAESFGVKNFRMNHDNWLSRETAIVQRLIQDPFFKVDAIVAWDLDKLNADLPFIPRSKYAKDICYNEDSGSWDRRVTTEWKVSYRPLTKDKKRIANKPVNVLKQQGLNLDTNEGFHIINRGLTAQVVPNAFRDVKLTYPIIVNSTESREEQVKRLQKLYIQNLKHIYDPFSWVARREHRFRGGFSRELLSHFSGRRYRIKDRDWFDPVLTQFLNDVITIKRHGTKEIYDLYVYQKYERTQNILGDKLDLLNWHSGEKRKGQAPQKKLRINFNFNNPSGARFIILDTYMRYPNEFITALRSKLTQVKRTENGQEIIQETIEETTGIPFKEYLKIANKAQKGIILKHRDT
ncbi:MAG: hypothetical protein CMI18_09605 [Opitutaceae bacterium]|nr:hypothetical protein [Opitutaceae bacterium]